MFLQPLLQREVLQLLPQEEVQKGGGREKPPLCGQRSLGKVHPGPFLTAIFIHLGHSRGNRSIGWGLADRLKSVYPVFPDLFQRAAKPCATYFLRIGSPASNDSYSGWMHGLISACFAVPRACVKVMSAFPPLW